MGKLNWENLRKKKTSFSFPEHFSKNIYMIAIITTKYKAYFYIGKTVFVINISNKTKCSLWLFNSYVLMFCYDTLLNRAK